MKRPVVQLSLALLVCGVALLVGLQMSTGQPNPPGIEKPALPIGPGDPVNRVPDVTWEYWIVSAKDFGLLCAAENASNDPRNPDRMTEQRKQLALDKIGNKGWELAGTEVEKGTTSVYIFKRKK